MAQKKAIEGTIFTQCRAPTADGRAVLAEPNWPNSSRKVGVHGRRTACSSWREGFLAFYVIQTLTSFAGNWCVYTVLLKIIIPYTLTLYLKYLVRYPFILPDIP